MTNAVFIRVSCARKGWCIKMLSGSRSKRTSILVLLWFVIILIDRMHDMSVLFMAITLLILLTQMIFLQKSKVLFPYIGSKTVFVKLYLGFLVYEIMITFINILIDYTHYLTDGLKTVIMIPLLTFMFFYVLQEHIDWKYLFFLFKYTGLAMAVIAVAETVTRQSLFYGFMDENSRYLVNAAAVGTSDFRAFVCFCHPILAALFFLVIFSICIYYPEKSIFLQIVEILILLAAIYGTKSRSSWLSFCVLTFLIAIDKLRKLNTLTKRKFLRIVVTGVFVSVLFFVLRKPIMNILTNIMERFALVLSSSSKANSRVVRLSNLYNVLMYVKQNIIFSICGRGNDYALRFSSENVVGNGWGYGMDNQYLTFLLNTGVIGLFSIFMILEKMTLFFYRGRKTETKVAALIGIAILLTSFFFEGLDKWRTISFLFCLSLFGIPTNRMTNCLESEE